MVHKPAWFRSGRVFVSYAPTVGINKDGEELFVIDASTGSRTDQIDDKLAEDVAALVEDGLTTHTSRWVEMGDLTDRLIAVPVYFDRRPLNDLETLMQSSEMAGFTAKSLGDPMPCRKA